MEQTIKIFIDDVRKPSDKHKTDGWILCTSYQDFSDVIDSILEQKKDWISEISFDYILDDAMNGADCFKLLAQIIKKYGLPVPEKIYVHSEYHNAEKHFKQIAANLWRDYETPVYLHKIGLLGGCNRINPLM